MNARVGKPTIKAVGGDIRMRMKKNFISKSNNRVTAGRPYEVEKIRFCFVCVFYQLGALRGRKKASGFRKR